MDAPVAQRRNAMTTEHQKELRELAANEIDAIAGAGEFWGFGPLPGPPTGFGVKTDNAIAVQNANEHLKGSFIQVPPLR
jgi:hypothetical protein